MAKTGQRARLYGEFWGEVVTNRAGAIIGLERATLKRLSDSDARELQENIYSVVSPHKEPMIAEIVRKNDAYIRGLVEAVNDNSKQGFGGMAADGSELTLQWLTPQDFHVCGDDELPHYSGWQRWQDAGRIERFIGNDPAPTGEEEGLIIVAWANGVSAPVVDALKVYKGTEESVVEPLAWIRKTVCCKAWDPVKAEKASGVGFDGCTDWSQNCFYNGGSQEMPIYEMRKPILIPPETRWHIDTKYLFSGCDALQPIGFRVRTAQAAWALTF